MEICGCFIRLLFWICFSPSFCCSTEFSLEPTFRCFFLCVLGTMLTAYNHTLWEILFSLVKCELRTQRNLFIFFFFIRLTPIFSLLLFCCFSFILSDQHFGANYFSHSVRRSRRELSTMEEIKRSLSLKTCKLTVKFVYMQKETLFFSFSLHIFTQWPNPIS